MKKTDILKTEFKRVKKNSKAHIILAVLAALAMSGIAVIISPLDKAALTPIKWILLVLVPFVALLFFYAFVQKPERSVFWFIKWVYYICAPAVLVLMAGSGSTELYSQKFFSRFLPKWAAVWWLGILILYALMRIIEQAAWNGLAKDSTMVRYIYDIAVMYTPQKRLSSQKRNGKSKWIAASVCILLVALAVFLGTVTLYLYSVYTNMEFEAILFTMRFATGGLAIEDIIAGTAIFVVFAAITVYLCFHLIKCFNNDELVVADTNKDGKYTLVMSGKKRAFNIVLSVVLLFGGTVIFSNQTNFFHYLSVKQDKSDIYEKYYVEPDESVITFPEKKRNLIYIYLESMETTYASKEAGGSQERNYISELTELANYKDSVNFSNTQLLGGASVYVPSITYTMGSTVAQTSGVSLNTKLFTQSGKVEFPAVRTLEDILHDNGYNQLYIEGSKGEFSMYDKYVGKYDDCKVFDRKTAADEGYTDENADYMWKWGIEDKKLFEITKELITDMSQKDKPFFVTMYTMDTHSFESGHRCSNCDNSISNDYLASVNCSSKLTAEFVEWVKQQPFYENTTIILVGDHLGNKKTSKVEIDDDYQRTTYNCIINPAKKAVNNKERIFSSLDMFPTTLSAIGVQIKGNRLGLGTDLFSSSQTLCEKLGKKEYKQQLEQDSEYYNNNFFN